MAGRTPTRGFTTGGESPPSQPSPIKGEGVRRGAHESHLQGASHPHPSLPPSRGKESGRAPTRERGAEALVPRDASTPLSATGAPRPTPPIHPHPSLPPSRGKGSTRERGALPPSIAHPTSPTLTPALSRHREREEARGRSRAHEGRPYTRHTPTLPVHPHPSLLPSREKGLPPRVEAQ